ncbi:MAG: phenylacetate-CoA ligase [Colwellia sp.]|jgi:phenylacetate-CoA ligase
MKGSQMSLTEKVYFSLPIFLQNIAVSFMGIKLKKERYTTYSSEFLRYLKKKEYVDVESIKKIQSEMFNETVQAAVTQTKFYKAWLIDSKHGNEMDWSLDDIHKFPIIEKSTAKLRQADFLNQYEVENSRIINLHTSGTTGTPLKVSTNKKYRSAHYAFFTRLRQSVGLSRLPRRVTLFGRIIMLADENKPPFWRYDRAQKNLLFSSYHLNEKNLVNYVKKIQTFKPEEIFSYPSSLFVISEYMNKRDITLDGVKLIMTTAEKLQAGQRKSIEKAFNSKVTNQYGCTEMSFFAAECEYGILHSHPEHGHIEVLKEDGTISDEGTGELIATGFINRVMPIIRYKVGDRVTLKGAEKCKCGRSYPSIVEVEGRVDDVLMKKDGTPVGRLDPVFKGDFAILAASIIQHESSDVEVQLIPTESFSEKDKLTLIKELEKRFGVDISVSVNLVKVLPKMPNGKHKAVIGNYKKAVK